MSWELLLEWAINAVSLFNTILLLWLGLTVLLNAEKRTWGIWGAGLGSLAGAAFFVSHLAIIGQGLLFVSQGMNFWWFIGWVPAIVSPFAWYVVMLWYSGFWDSRHSRLRRRQRLWLAVTTLLALSLLALWLFANPLGSYSQVARLDLSSSIYVGNFPLLALLYPAYILLCIGLSLDGLRDPAPSGRVMGELARRRAQPWLVGAALGLLVVSLLVAGAMLWSSIFVRQRPTDQQLVSITITAAWLDLLITSFIGAAIALVGQAIVSYEIFAGKTLPRRGLVRQWHSAMILAGGYGLVVGGSLALQIRPVYSVLLATFLMTLFYALLNWRSFAEREGFIRSLRPFVASQRLYEDLLALSEPVEGGLAPTPTFRALCEEVLGARLAFLMPLGPLSALVGSPIAYPSDMDTPVIQAGELAARFIGSQPLCVPLEPAEHGGAAWAVPLWGSRGLIGVLLLGEKRDGGLYSQEEIEIARSSGERLIDTQASIEMAQRLMALQRRQLADSQVLDRRTRRVLHDDVLPILHTVMLKLSGGQPPKDDVLLMLADAHRRISDMLHDMPTVTSREVTRLGLVAALRRSVEEELSGAFDEVSWEIAPAAAREAQHLQPLTAEALFYAAREVVRNAARYARDKSASRPLHLRIGIEAKEGLEIRIEDDGVGLEGASKSNGGSGHGLALHSTMMAVVGGSLETESVPGMYTRVVLRLPIDEQAVPGAER